ncbi:NAD-dependent epimerase/dehydratase family protein [Cellulomonas sp. McL0617]|uniref:NAD-dependent epimerase/dehydratase family protein n=1 Tax=Cellulomonas sp. McL0617 TaxID=3415675 RepID=UPI003CF12C30
MRVVVVGASGNVGTALLRRFAADETVTSVVAIARRPPSPPSPPYDSARWVACDASAPDGVDRLAGVFAGADSVVHLAWATEPRHNRSRLRAENVGSTRNVLAAVRRSGVAHLVVASSVGAYSPAPDDVPRGEGWATEGIRTSPYSADKAEVERLLDDVPDLAIARLRTALVLQHSAGQQLARSVLGPWVPKRALDGHLATLSWPVGLRFQTVHATDVAAAFREAVVRHVEGPFNVAGPGVLRGQDVADVVARGRLRELPVSRARLQLAAAWAVRAVPVGPGWLDLALAAPLLDTSRAARELDFRPQWSALASLRDAVTGIAAGAGTDSPALRPRRSAR